MRIQPNRQFALYRMAFYQHFEMCSIVEIEHMSWMHKISNLIHAIMIYAKQNPKPNQTKISPTQQSKYFSYHLYIQTNKMNPRSPSLSFSRTHIIRLAYIFHQQHTHIFLNNIFQDMLLLYGIHYGLSMGRRTSVWVIFYCDYLNECTHI